MAISRWKDKATTPDTDEAMMPPGGLDFQLAEKAASLLCKTIASRQGSVNSTL